MTLRESAKLQMYLAVAAVCERPEHAAAVARIPDFDAVLRAFLALPIPLDESGRPVASELIGELLLEGDLCLERMDDLSTDLMAEFPAFVRAYDVARLIGLVASRPETPAAASLPATRPGKRGAPRGKALGRHRLPAAAAVTADGLNA